MDRLSPGEAFIAVAMAAAYADGVMGEEEDEDLADALASCRAIAHMSEADIRDAMLRVDTLARARGEGGILADASAALPPELRPTAFYMAVSLVLSDDELEAEERAFIAELAAALAVPGDLAARIVEVCAIRNRA